MSFKPLPQRNVKPVIPPIKCQGIKTKLVGFILGNIRWDGRGRWIEPFVGSGVVVFSVRPKRAIINDINPHIINLYRAVFDGTLTPEMAKEHLTREGGRLLSEGEDYYYLVRRRFNEAGSPLDFLFLNRSCFNGLMRFNRRGKFNVPYCRKPERFRQAYVTKVVNQIRGIREIMYGKQWDFRIGDWRTCLAEATEEDFVYVDPPYIGRHTDYYNSWSERDAVEMPKLVQSLPCGFAASMWKENKYRTNPHLAQCWAGMTERTTNHFYHVGSTETLRNAMEEVLLIRPGYEAPPMEPSETLEAVQLGLFP